MRASELVDLAKEILESRDYKNNFDKRLLKNLADLQTREVDITVANKKIMTDVIEKVHNTIDSADEEDVEDMKKSFAETLKKESYFATILDTVIDVVEEESSGNVNKMYG